MPRLLATAAAALATWGALTLGQPAQAAVLPMGSADATCQASGKVYVKATYQGTTAASGCVQPDTGLKVLRAVASLNFDTGSMICQINSVPSTCPDKASLQAYWTYWLWSGSSWQYSGVGPASHRAEAGDVEAWNWGNSSTPPPWTPSAPAPAPTATTTRPTATATTKPASSKPATSKPATTRPATSRPSTSATSVRPTSGSTTSKTTSAPRASTTGGTTSRPGVASSLSPSATTPVAPSQGSSSADVPASTSSSPDASSTPVPATSAPVDQGSPWGTLATLGVLGAGAGVFALRTRWRA